MPPGDGTRNAAFWLFCVFILGYFMRLTARVEVLGQIHFDLMLAALTALAIVMAPRPLRTSPRRSLTRWHGNYGSCSPTSW